MSFLNHVRIVEGSAFVAAPYAGMTLAQMGAEVIRFDPPGGGIDYRRMPRDPETGHSLYWAGLNKGKKSICVDFRKPEGRELIQSLVTAPGEGGGILLTNFAGLDWLDHDLLAKKRADLISLTVMGNHDGSSEVDYTVNAAMGLPLMTGPAGNDLPVNHVLPAWDIACGLQGAVAILGALIDRMRTGKGRQMTLALSDVAMSVLSNLGMTAEAERGQLRLPGGNDLFGGFGRDFKTRDGRRVMVVALTVKQWKALQHATHCEHEIALLEEGLAEDLSEEETRYRHRDAIASIIERWCSARLHAEVAVAFETSGVCWGPYQTMQEMMAHDPRASLANPLWSEVEHHGVGRMRTAGLPIGMVGEPRAEQGGAPALGEHTEEVLAEVAGLPSHAIASLADRGIVAFADQRRRGEAA